MTIELEHRVHPSTRGPVHYWSAGTGEAVVLLHGATVDHQLWQHQLEPFAADFRVLAVDLPGHGRSRPYAPFSLARCAEEVAAILDREGVARAHLVGQSMGGYIAQVLALEYPDRVASFVGVDTSPFDASYYSTVDRLLLAVTPALLALYPQGMLVESIAANSAASEAGRAYMREVLAGMGKAEIRRIMAEVYRGLLAYADRRFQLACPAFLVVGELDVTGKVLAYSQRWAAAEDLELCVVPGGGHNSNFDAPEPFNRAVLAFLRGLPR